MTATVEGFKAAYKRRDLPECERLADELERAGGLDNPMLARLGAAYARLGDAAAVLRLHRRAKLLSDYEQAPWEVLTIRLRCNLGDLEGGLSHLRLMRKQQLPISALAAAPIFAGCARSRRPATAVECLELLAAWGVKLENHTMNLAADALAGVDEIPAAGKRLQSMRKYPRLARLSRSRSHTAMCDALRVEDHDGAARLLRRALDAGDGVDRRLFEKIKAGLGPADRAELEYRELLNEIARGCRPGGKLTAVLVNLATAGDTDSIKRLFESVRAKGLPIGPVHIECTMTAAARARDPDLACRALELMHGSGVPFAADEQRGLLTACRTPADAPRAHELLLGVSEQAQTVSETLALLSMMIDDSRETTESALAAARTMIRDGRRLTTPYWETLLDRAPADTAPLLVESVTRELNAGGTASAFCTDVLRLLASSGDVALVDDVFAAMVDNGVSVKEQHLCALLHPLADAEAHEALRTVAHVVVERGLTLDTTAQNALLRGLRRDPGDALAFLRDNAVAIGIRSSTIDAWRIDWLIEHDDIKAARELARGLDDDDAAHAHMALLTYHSRIGDAAAAAQQLEALIAALQPPPDPYDVSQAIRARGRRSRR